MSAPTLKILQGDWIERLRELPDQSVHCVVTSPPYWGLRDYGVAGQLGLEKTPEEYVAKVVAGFREVRRVLRDDGTLWLNIGDSYAASTRGTGGNRIETSSKQRTNNGSYFDSDHFDSGLKAKDLCGIPWRVAFALQQPYETHLIPDQCDRAWLAAMIDGEGCITVPEAKSPHGSGSSFPPIVQIRMCDTECLQKCVQLTGKGGNLNEQLPPSYAESNQRAAYQWRINGPTVSAVLADVYTFLLIKRKQACVAWTLQKIRESYETKRGVPIPDVALGKQQECRRLIGKLNQREAVDLPTWIEEPKFIIEPGWYLRSDVIWAKPNPMPESVTDRPTKSHEYIFLLSKSQRYFYDAEAIKEAVTGNAHAHGPNGFGEKPTDPGHGIKNNRSFTSAVHNSTRKDLPSSRNKRTVWTVATAPYSEAHFATFPPDLIKPCILAGTSARGCCPKCGAPWERQVEPTPEYAKILAERKANGRRRNDDLEKLGTTVGTSNPSVTRSTITKGWTSTCQCGADPIPCTVLDPFGGSGTTGKVALELGRGAILIELNPAYVKLAEKRTFVTPGLQLA